MTATDEELRNLFTQLIDHDRREGINPTVTADGVLAFAKLGRERVLAITAERDRYRLAWLSARQRAEAYGEGILRHVEDRDTWMGWEKQQAARAWAAEARLQRIRGFAEAVLGSGDTASHVLAQSFLRLLDAPVLIPVDRKETSSCP